MSIRLIADVWDFGPEDPIDTATLAVLANFANEKGLCCYPSVDTNLAAVGACGPSSPVRRVHMRAISTAYAGRLRWTDADRSRRAIARVSNDRLSELSEVGRRIRLEIRRQHVCLQSKKKIMSALSIPSTETWSHPRSPWFIKAIMATIDALREALEMRRAAHRSYPFYDE